MNASELRAALGTRAIPSDATIKALRYVKPIIGAAYVQIRYALPGTSDDEYVHVYKRSYDQLRALGVLVAYEQDAGRFHVKPLVRGYEAQLIPEHMRERNAR